ncbi:MAG: hypothetical protein ACAI35_18020 [Candidatus Methylacidiphilales bacterium]|nr:hypothetical protein [Candidatus Methylacidiphilales bacterium]
MKSLRIATFALTLLAAAVATPVPDGAFAKQDTAKVMSQEELERSLQVVINELLDAQTRGDAAAATRITRALLPDGARLKEALHPEIDSATREKILALHAKLPKDDASLAKLLAAKPGQTVVAIHGSTTEQLAAYKEGTTAFAEFPGGAQKLAQGKVLKPGQTFFEVEFLAPGSDKGMKYHLFYWDGNSWSMLGPIWRVTAS